MFDKKLYTDTFSKLKASENTLTEVMKMKTKKRRVPARTIFVVVFILAIALSTTAFAYGEAIIQVAENFYVTHFIQEPVIHIFEEPILIERIIVYQDILLADFDAGEEMIPIICLLCDSGTLGWVQGAQGLPYKGPEFKCYHGFPRNTDDPWFRDDEWAYQCGDCDWIALTEMRTVFFQEDCYGRN